MRWKFHFRLPRTEFESYICERTLCSFDRKLFPRGRIATKMMLVVNMAADRKTKKIAKINRKSKQKAIQNIILRNVKGLPMRSVILNSRLFQNMSLLKLSFVTLLDRYTEFVEKIRAFGTSYCKKNKTRTRRLRTGGKIAAVAE